jgi:hypothetical protein
VIGWLKDLDGRYVYVNRGYVEQLDAPRERIIGRVDPELTPREGIDGPRLQHGDVLDDEPIQLEYRVAAYDGRPALAVLRFPVRDGDGTPIGVCGVAAPIAQAQLARAECSELMELERGGSSNSDSDHNSSGDAGDQVHEQRAAALVDASANAAKRAHDLACELAQERGRAEALDAELAEVRERLAGLERGPDRGEADRAQIAALEQTVERERARAGAHKERAAVAAAEAECQRARAEAAEAALRAARRRDADAVKVQQARADEMERDAAAARERDEQLSTELAAATEELKRLEADRSVLAGALEHARADAQRPQAADPQPHSSPDGGPSWSGVAQRALSAALAQASEWRTGIRDAVKVLGSEGQWDAVSVWLPDDRRPLLRCAAMWVAEADGRGEFETRTWQHPELVSRTELGRAFSTGAAAWLTGIARSKDERLLTVVEEGMATALVVPIRDGRSPVAVLELLSRQSATSDEEVAASIDAVALQLGHFWHLLRLGAEPHWRLGKF